MQIAEKIAVDVVLLPSEEDMRRIIDFTVDDVGSAIKLDTTDYLPHISLTMGVIDQDALEDARVALNDVTQAHDAVECTLDRINTNPTPDGKRFLDANVVKTDELVALQIDVMNRFRGIFSFEEAVTDMFVSPPEVPSLTPYWVNKYYETNPEGFRPHMTMGEGTVSNFKQYAFRAHRLAFVRLGGYCTARKIITEVELG